MRLSDETRADIEAHYRRHSETYQRIWGKLDDVNERFLDASESGKIAYLKLSYINSLISVQCPLHVHEEALNRVVAGESFDEAFTSVNYNGQKIKYGRETLANDEVWSQILSDLQSDGLDSAHKTALDGLKFVGTVKVPFTFAMLGFMSKMCLDANVVRLMGLEEPPSTVVVEKYERQCQEVRDHFPVLTEELEPFELQWLIFDYQRFNRTGMSEEQKARIKANKQVTYHDSWFNAALRDVSEIEEIVTDL